MVNTTKGRVWQTQGIAHSTHSRVCQRYGKPTVSHSTQQAHTAEYGKLTNSRVCRQDMVNLTNWHTNKWANAELHTVGKGQYYYEILLNILK